MTLKKEKNKKIGVESNPDYLIDAYLLAFHDVNPSWQAF